MLKRTLAGLALLFLAACGQVSTPATATLPATDTNVPIPSATETNTPLPPVETATPTLQPTITDTPAPTFTSTPVIYGPADFPAGINPLTGLLVADPSLLDRRPIAVKVNIVPRYNSRPPWGLSFADIVYDYYHNDGYTRFHAIYYGSDAELVGPIRSGRLLDHELVLMYDSIFAYGSADALVNQRFFGASYSNRLILESQRANCPPTPTSPLCRFEPDGPDHLLASTTALSAYITSRGIENGAQNLDGMTFNSLPPANGEPANQVFVRYSGDDYLRWDYDPLTGRYLRFQDNVYDTGQGEEYTPLVDRLNNTQIGADNVVIIFARHEYYQQPPNEIVEIYLDGSGTAYAFRDGMVYQVMWNRPTTDSVLFLTNPDGTPFPFHPGVTWFQVVGTSTNLSQPTAGAWRFDFRIP